MMNLILLAVAMMVEIAAEKMLILKFAQNVNANSKRHVRLDIIAHWWVTVIATMNSTIQIASMMAWTAVDLMLPQISVPSAHVTVSIVQNTSLN